MHFKDDLLGVVQWFYVISLLQIIHTFKEVGFIFHNKSQ